MVFSPIYLSFPTIADLSYSSMISISLSQVNMDTFGLARKIFYFLRQRLLYTNSRENAQKAKSVFCGNLFWFRLDGGADIAAA